LEFHQNKCHPEDVPDTRRQCAKATDWWAQGVAGWPNPLADRPGFMSVWPEASWTCVYMRRGRPRQWRKSVEASPPGRPATWWVTASPKLVELPHGPVNTPYWWKSKHTPHFGDSTCKASILSVVARHSLVGRVVRLGELEGLLACREPSSYLERRRSGGILQGPTRFLGSSLLECRSSTRIL
jgi:hypothetical protein